MKIYKQQILELYACSIIIDSLANEKSTQLNQAELKIAAKVLNDLTTEIRTQNKLWSKIEKEILNTPIEKLTEDHPEHH